MQYKLALQSNERIELNSSNGIIEAAQKKTMMEHLWFLKRCPRTWTYAGNLQQRFFRVSTCNSLTNICYQCTLLGSAQAKMEPASLLSTLRVGRLWQWNIIGILTTLIGFSFIDIVDDSWMTMRRVHDGLYLLHVHPELYPKGLSRDFQWNKLQLFQSHWRVCAQFW